MARLKKGDKELILADWHTGQFSHSELGKKYNTSHVTIGKICKGIEPKFKDKVTEQVAINTALNGATYNEVTAFNKVVDEKTKYQLFIQNATLKNVSTMMKKVNEDISIPDHESVQKTLDKAGQTLGVIERFAPKVEVKQVQQQNNEQQTIKVVYE